MGLSLDIVEDNYERIGQYIDTTSHNLAFENSIKYYTCDYCSFKTTDINDLNNHIIERHSKDYCYFSVNNEIGRGNETFIINRPISENSIKWFGNRKDTKFNIEYIDISFSRKVFTLINLDNMMKDLPSNFEGKLKITAEVDRNLSIVIYLEFPQSIILNEKELIEKINNMQKELNSYSFDSVKMQELGCNFKSYDEICWNGFFDYSLGMSQLIKGDYKLAKDKLENSYNVLWNLCDLIYLKRNKTGYLKEYTQLLKMIKTVLCILEIKMCFFNNILQTSDKSIFYPFKALKNRKWVKVDWNMIEYLSGIFFDDSTKYFLKTCVFILNKDFEAAKEALELYKRCETYNVNKIVSKNAQCLYDFLRGRLEEVEALNEKNNEIRKNHLVKALQYYSFIKKHREFSKEIQFYKE